ncbi:MAG: pyridoxal 5'-phosphate synthase glutaminase subunit PdxT [Dehalococcoidia bacterium]
MRIGVLALQGTFIEHISAMQRIGVEAPPIRLPDQLDNLDGLVIPGGESTSILELMKSFGFVRPLKQLAQAGFPVLGTCAGLVCLARKVSNYDMETLAVMDMAVKRNASGRQINSFESDLPIPVLGDKPFPAVFIRAPFVDEVGPKMEVMARLPGGVAVACRQENLMATAFHPELTSDLRLHSYFVSIIGR